MFQWVKAKPVVRTQYLSTGVTPHLNSGIQSTDDDSDAFIVIQPFTCLRKCAIAAPIVMIAVFLIGYFIIIHLAPHLAPDFLINETISAVANDGDAYPAFIITNTLLSFLLLFIGIIRSRQIDHQIAMIMTAGESRRHPIHEHMRRLNIATLIMGGLAVLGAEMLTIIRIGSNSSIKYRKYLPSNNKELAILSYFAAIFSLTSASLVAFTIEQSGGQFEVETQFRKDTNFLEWLGVFLSFVYFLGYSVLFYRHPLREEMIEEQGGSIVDPTNDPQLII